MTIRTRFGWAQRIRVCTLPLVSLLAVVFLLVGLNAQGPAPEYNVTDLGAFEPLALNSNGDVVGYARIGGSWRVFSWSHGVLTDLGTMGGSDAVSTGLNDSGQVVGVFNGPSGFEHFIFTNGTVTRLGTHPAYYYLTGINNAGEVAGVEGPDVPYFRAFRYSGGTVDHLAMPGCGWSVASHINDSGFIVGQVGGGICGYSSPTLWRSGSLQILPVPPGTTGAQAFHINAVGQIAGGAYTPAGNALLWQPDGSGSYTYVNLGPGPDGYLSYGRAINDAGVIVGDLETNSNGEHGFVWDSAHGMRDLNALIPSDSGIVLGQACAINNAGMILARAPGGHHAYLLTPVSSGDTTPPTLTVPDPLSIEATSPAGAVVTFDVTASDPDDAAGPVMCATSSGSVFPLGTTTVNCSSTDTNGNTGSGSFTVTVQDTTPPTITSVVPSQAQLWPPNNKMVPISLAVDATDLVTLTPLCQIASVSSSEPGPGQWQTTGPLTLNLLASRNGNGNGRTYTVSVQCSDAAGNRSSRSATVVVPHD